MWVIFRDRWLVSRIIMYSELPPAVYVLYFRSDPAVETFVFWAYGLDRIYGLTGSSVEPSPISVKIRTPHYLRETFTGRNSSEDILAIHLPLYCYFTPQFHFQSWTSNLVNGSCSLWRPSRLTYYIPSSCQIESIFIEPRNPQRAPPRLEKSFASNRNEHVLIDAQICTFLSTSRLEYGEPVSLTFRVRVHHRRRWSKPQFHANISSAKQGLLWHWS